MKIQIKSILLATVATLALASCAATVDVTKTAAGFYDPVPASHVKILKTEPERDFVEIATVNANNFKPTEIAKLHNGLRTKAGPAGADAVIITDEGVYRGDWGVVRYASGVAIKFK